jgi:hypothetical protein
MKTVLACFAFAALCFVAAWFIVSGSPVTW